MQSRYRGGACLGVEPISDGGYMDSAGKKLREYRMDTITASDAKIRFSALLDTVQTGPVIISKHGKAVAVMMSAAEFDKRLSCKREAVDESGKPELLVDTRAPI